MATGTASAPPYAYRAFGLRLRTPFPCPELAADASPAGAVGERDVVVRLGATPDALDAPVARGGAFEATADELLLALPRVGRFHVRGGRDVTITPDAAADDGAVRLHLLGSCLGAVLHQRGVLALHASAVRLGAAAVLLLGVSGAGKSTLAAALVRRGAALLGDDLAAVVLDAAGAPRVLPGVRQLRLWADAAEHLAEDTTRLRRVRAGLEKFGVPVAAGAESPDEVGAAVPVRHAFVLEADNEPTIRMAPLADAARFTELTHHTYRYRFLAPAARAGHFRLAARTAAHVAMYRVRRPRHPFLLDELADRVVAAVGA